MSADQAKTTRRNLRVRKIMRYDPSNRLLRVGRVMWERGIVGDGDGYSVKLSVGLRPALFRWKRGSTGWLLTVLGLRVHYDRSYGGTHV